jgi:hypothetical protein
MSLLNIFKQLHDKTEIYILDILKDIQDISKIKLNDLDFNIITKDSHESKYSYKLTLCIHKKEILQFKIDCNYMNPSIDSYNIEETQVLEQNMNIKLGVGNINGLKDMKPIDEQMLSNNDYIYDYIHNHLFNYQYSDKSIILNGGKWINHPSNIEFYMVISIHDEYMKKNIKRHLKKYVSIVKNIIDYRPNSDVYENSIVLKFALNNELPNYTIIGHQLYHEDGVFDLKRDIENIENSTHIEFDEDDDRNFLTAHKNFIHFNDEKLLKNNICLIFNDLLKYTILNSGLWSYRSSYLMLTEGSIFTITPILLCNTDIKLYSEELCVNENTEINTKSNENNNNVIKYLFNDLIIREVCSYLYEELN